MRVRSLAVFVLASCGPLTPAQVRDSGVDAVDAGVDAGLDAGVDAGFDAGPAFDAGLCDGGFCPPERITGELIDPWDLAVDDANLYWLEYGLATSGSQGQVMKQPKHTTCLKRDAGCATDLNMNPLGRLRVDTMTLAGDELCWTEGYQTARDVVCQSLSTNRERFVARRQSWATRPLAAGGTLYWITTADTASTGQVMSRSLSAPDGTTPTSHATGRSFPNNVAVLDGHVVWTESGSTIDAGAVLASPLDGGEPMQIAWGQRVPLSVVACQDRLIWVNYRDQSVMTGALAPDSGVRLVGGQSRPLQVVCDATHIYWLNAGLSANGADGELWQARLDGTEAKPMVRGIALAWAIALDDTYVYYIAQGTVTRVDGFIWRMRKHP